MQKSSGAFAWIVENIAKYMKEYKFRLWSKVSDTMSPPATLEMMMSSSFDMKGLPKGIRPFSDEFVEFQQFIGKQDRNDVDIYVGDIVETQANGNKVIGIVVFHEDRMQFGVEAVIKVPEGTDNSPLTVENIVTSKSQRPLVIGNIYQNPELIPCTK